MHEILLLIRVHIDEIDLAGVERYFHAAKERLLRVGGSLGQSLWRDPTHHGSLLIAFEFRDLDTADRGADAIVDLPLLSEALDADGGTVERIRVVVEGRYGTRVSEADERSFLSISVRISDPGYGIDLAEEIDQLFQHLRLIPGFSGCVYGVGDDLPEEVIGVVTWANREAFVASLPPTQRPYEVKLFERVH